MRDACGEVFELRFTYDPGTLNAAPVGRKVRGTIHGVSAGHAVQAMVRLYDRLFTVPDPSSDKDHHYKGHLNTRSLGVLQEAVVEPSVTSAPQGERYRFERKGYYYIDPFDSRYVTPRPSAPSGVIPIFYPATGFDHGD